MFGMEFSDQPLDDGLKQPFGDGFHGQMDWVEETRFLLVVYFFLAR